MEEDICFIPPSSLPQCTCSPYMDFEAAETLAHLSRSKSRTSASSYEKSESERVCVKCVESTDSVCGEEWSSYQISEDYVDMRKEESQDIEPCKGISTDSSKYFSTKRSWQDVTEAEKEARRLRRILANRESARQTIRRRQELCDELMKKEEDLARENEGLKKEKEVAVKEYEYLKNTNEHLKAQVDSSAREFRTPILKGMGGGADDSPGPEACSSCLPMGLYNQSMSPQFMCVGLGVGVGMGVGLAPPFVFPCPVLFHNPEIEVGETRVDISSGIVPEDVVGSGTSEISTRSVSGWNEMGRRLVDSTAAAEARKRRKELNRLKQLYSRQCRPRW